MIDRVCGYRFKKTHRHGLCEAVIGILILISTVPALAAQTHLEPVTIQLRWFHYFQFSGYYAAVEKGLYADEGLQVSLQDLIPGNDRLSVLMNLSLTGLF
jgi:ABC-type nitrate/sulfonate/bicarbonate transport system substrate-binding protein